MATQSPRPRPVVVEFEFSRLASQYLSEAYAQVLPEIRFTTKAQKFNESARASAQEVVS